MNNSLGNCSTRHHCFKTALLHKLLQGKYKKVSVCREYPRTILVTAPILVTNMALKRNRTFDPNCVLGPALTNGAIETQHSTEHRAMHILNLFLINDS